MKISEIQLLKETDGLQPFHIGSLGSIVVLAGQNGSGKTRMLKLLERYAESLREKREQNYLSLKVQAVLNDDTEEPVILDRENVSGFEIVNYSHYDAQLQSPKKFTPYVISRAKELLQVCDYEQTALNSFLLLEDMIEGYSEKFRSGAEFQKFSEKFAEPLGLRIEWDKEKKSGFRLCGQSMEDAVLSPGQQYLLRIAVACYCNQGNEKMVFFMDEPELHLHPRAQIELIEALRNKFPNTQFWIATHSLSLISYLTVVNEDTTVLHLKDGKTNLLRSNSGDLLKGLIGKEENRFAIRQLMAAPDEYACNKFAVECLNPAGVAEAKEKDPQLDLLKIFREGDTVLDYGAGKGRILEELACEDIDMVRKMHYYAYDESDKYAKQCKKVMSRYGVPDKNYYNNKEELLKEVSGKADWLLLVNVLHEIDPMEWAKTFEFFRKVLDEKGEVVIVEREELTVGEAPYNNGFLMLTEHGANELFGKGNYIYTKHEKKEHIVRYEVKKDGLNVTNEKIKKCVNEIKKDAFSRIRDLKHNVAAEENDLKKYYAGIELAFYLHQYANAVLIQEENEKTMVLKNDLVENAE